MPRCGISCLRPQITGQVRGQAWGKVMGRWCDQAALLGLIFTTTVCRRCVQSPITCLMENRCHLVSLLWSQPVPRGYREAFCCCVLRLLRAPRASESRQRLFSTSTPGVLTNPTASLSIYPASASGPLEHQGSHGALRGRVSEVVAPHQQLK